MPGRLREIEEHRKRWREQNPGKKRMGDEFLVDKDGKKVRIRCYETVKYYVDSQTVVYMDDKVWEYYEKRGNDPDSKYLAHKNKGVYEMVSITGHGDCRIGRHLGLRIPFDALIENLKNMVYADLGL